MQFGFMFDSPLLEAAWALGIVIVSALVAWFISYGMHYIQHKLEGKRKWRLIEVDGVGNFKKEITKINLKAAKTISNNFNIIADLMQDMCLKVPEFSDWFSNLVTSYITSGYNAEIMTDSIDKFIDFSNRYLDALNINFEAFTRIDKTTKTSIIFYKEDNRAIALSSTALKLYSMFRYDAEPRKNILDKEPCLQLPKNSHRKMYEGLVKPCVPN